MAAQPTYRDKVEPYVVKPGDTISQITQRMLGDSTFWEDNWKLNPQVRDPDKLRIGQVLQIITERKVIAESARVVEAVNRTEKLLRASEWERAAVGDELGSGHGLRTRQSSTAELRFNAESSLRLGEYSQVFLARKSTSLRGVDRGQVTVQRGAVDLVFEPLKRPRTEIELVAGPASARPSLEAGKKAEIRAGAAEDGGARVMVYRGQSAVSAAGTEVAVAEGMGTAVPESGPPARPEKLLAAPGISEPALRWNYSNGLLRWQPVEGAAAYRLEVCADAACRTLLQTARVDTGASQHQVDPLPVGSHVWRVLAISASGLDGYTSPTAALEVTDGRPDLAGPMLALVPVSGFVQGVDGATRLGPGARLRVEGHDEQSGLQRIELHHEGRSQTIQPGTVLDLAALQAGARLVSLDMLGNRSEQQIRIDTAE
nr:LysM peptidoglycan-binding domain-containing protein [Lysobacter sp. CAU 1642]